MPSSVIVQARAPDSGRDAVWIIRTRHGLDRSRRKSLRRVRRQLSGIVRYRLSRIDGRIAVRVRAWLHHARLSTPRISDSNAEIVAEPPDMRDTTPSTAS